MTSFQSAYVLVLLCSLLGAGYTIAGKFLASNINPISLTLLRVIIALLCFLPFIKLKAFKQLSKKDWVLLTIAGIFGIFLTNILYFKSLETTTALDASLINSLVPFFTLMVASICSGKMPKRMQLLSFTIGLVGVLLMTTEGNFNVSATWHHGHILMLVSVFTWVIYSIAAKYKSPAVSSELFTFGAFLIGLIPLLPLGIYYDVTTLISQLTPSEWFLIMYISAIATGLAYYLYVKSVENLGPDTAAYINYSAAPIFICVLSYLFFGESFTFWKAIGTICILFSLRLQNQH